LHFVSRSSFLLLLAIHNWSGVIDYFVAYKFPICILLAVAVSSCSAMDTLMNSHAQPKAKHPALAKEILYFDRNGIHHFGRDGLLLLARLY